MLCTKVSGHCQVNQNCTYIPLVNEWPDPGQHVPITLTKQFTQLVTEQVTSSQLYVHKQPAICAQAASHMSQAASHMSQAASRAICHKGQKCDLAPRQVVYTKVNNKRECNLS